MATSLAGSRRFPSLVLPFAALGAVVGHCAVTFLENPIVDVAANASPGIAAFGGGLAGIVIGLLLTRRGRTLAAREDDGWVRLPTRSGRASEFVRDHFLLLVTMIAGGVVVGGAVGVASGHSSGLGTGVFCGVLVAIAATPLAAAVQAAGVRAQRARHGSLVAAADRRAIWIICAGAAGLACVVTTIDWPAFAAGRVDPPLLGFATAIACSLVIAYLTARDLAALRAVRAIEADASLRAWERDVSQEAPRVDLGLGDAVRAEVASGASAYRAMDKERRLVVGSVEEARAALRRAVVQACVALGVVATVAGLHAFARTEWVAYSVEAAVCDQRPWWCAPTAHAAARHGVSPERVQHLLARACEAYRVSECDEACGAMIDALDDAGGPVPPESVLALVRTCQGGIGASCHAVVRHARHEIVSPSSGELRSSTDPSESERVLRLRRLACSAGDAETCEDLKRGGAEVTRR